MNCRWLLWLPSSLLLLNGCASVSAFQGLNLEDESVYVSGVAPLTQNKRYSCGPTCVAAVAARLNISPAEFRTKYPACPKEMTGRDLMVLADDLGLRAFAYQGSREDLEQHLRKGRPLIVMIPQPLIPGGGPVSSLLLTTWNALGAKSSHWVIVIGLTKNRDVIIHDPASGPMTIKSETFQRWWAQKDCLTVLITRR